MNLSDVDLLDRDRYVRGVPHEWYALLRERAPIFKHPEPDGPGFWVFSRHAALRLAERRRAAPGTDVLTTLLSADLDGAQLSPSDFGQFFALLAAAGNETTRNAIALGVAAFAEHPDQYERLIAEPALLDSAVEEVLRWTSPIMQVRRNVTEDFECHGVQLKAGDTAAICFVSANRDETVFDHASTFDIGREPNNHVAFGFGPHLCLGAPLARLELRVFFEELVRRRVRIELLAPPVRLRSNIVSGIKHFLVRLSDRNATTR